MLALNRRRLGACAVVARRGCGVSRAGAGLSHRARSACSCRSRPADPPTCWRAPSRPAMSTALKQPVVIENRAGGGGSTGVDAVAKSAPDGYTIGITGPGALVAAPFMTKVPYDATKDLAPIARVARVNGVIVVAASSPYKTLDDLVERRARSAGQTVVRLGRRRHADASRRRTPQHGSQDQAGACALSRRGARRRRSARRPHPDPCCPICPACCRRSRPARSARSPSPVRRARRDPRYADHRRGRLAQRAVRQLVWHYRAGRHAPGDSEKAYDAVAAALKSKEAMDQIAKQGAMVAPSSPQEFSELIAEEQSRWKKVVEATGAKME